ncbi:hypothetical protein GCM10018790_65440 [Kitasatospora xanthocidica]|nr:hypothetical protein GCM10018790_65440 [Kitasatospora xanthocidica]
MKAGGRGADWKCTGNPPGRARAAGRHVMALFLLVVIVAMVLGIVGVVVHGMLYLLAIGVLLLVADVVFLAVRSARSRRAVR